MLDLTVVIACKNRQQNLKYCLGSISHSAKLPRVYVVDFGNKDPIKVPYKWVKVIRVTRNTAKFHKARAVNIGIKNSRTKFTCVTDADQIFCNNYFTRVVNELNRNSKYFIMCKTYALHFIPKEITPQNIYKNYDKLLSIAKKVRSIYGDGCCHATTTKWFLDRGGYEESFIGWGYEDSDMAWRARKSGLKLRNINKYVSMIHLPHPVETHVGGYRNMQVQEANKVRYAKRRHNGILFGNRNRKWGEI